MNIATPALTAFPAVRRTAWIILGYYLAVLTPILAYAWLGHFRFSVNGLIAEQDPDQSFYWANAIVVVQFVTLLFPLISASTALTGLLTFGPPRDRRPGPDWHWDPSVKLIVAYVSRGNQPETVKSASSQTQAILEELGVSYVIEVVTDIEIPPENRLPKRGGDVLYFAVPADYKPPRGARYKARALQYLLEQRTVRLENREDLDNVWILHMDEESVLTQECVLGIQEHIEKYDLRRTPGAIGQGEILYNGPGYGKNDWVAAIDAARTGGDLGLFRTQYKAIHKPLVGMHGSYVLTPARIEREITWDVGGHGSITEDSYFALLAMERGVRFDWVEGFIREQSPFTVMDIIRQRRRWFCGLSHVASDPTLSFLTRITLRVHVIFWAFSALALPVPLIFLQQRFIFGNGVLPYWLFLMAAICTGMYASTYIVGAYRNLIHCQMPLHKKLWILLFAVFAWFFFIPALVECSGTLYGLFFPVTTFYVVAKDTKRDDILPATN